MHIIVHLYIMFMYIITFYVLGYLLFKDFCEHLPEDEQIPEINFYDEVRLIISLNIYLCVPMLHGFGREKCLCLKKNNNNRKIVCI